MFDLRAPTGDVGEDFKHNFKSVSKTQQFFKDYVAVSESLFKTIKCRIFFFALEEENGSIKGDQQMLP